MSVGQKCGACFVWPIYRPSGRKGLRIYSYIKAECCGVPWNTVNVDGEPCCEVVGDSFTPQVMNECSICGAATMALFELRYALCLRNWRSRAVQL